MKRALVAASLTFVFAACEDGPTQTFTSAPKGAGNQWNDGNSPSVTDPTVSQGFGTTVTGTNAMEICDAPTKKTKWQAAFAAPILPPKSLGGIDMTGGSAWPGFTVAQAEQQNCQSANYFDGLNYWGDNLEILIWYFDSTRRIYQMSALTGYTGALTFHSRDGLHNYKLVPGGQVFKDAHVMTLDWGSDIKVCSTSGSCDWARELGDAMTATFQPGLPEETDCRANAHCIINNIGDQAYLFVPASGVGIWIDNYHAAQPAPSTFSRIDVELEKVLPFSTGDVVLKLDAEGPTSKSADLGPAHKNCVLKFGMTYGDDFIPNCVAVSGDSTVDTDATNELLGGLRHSAERFSFDISGVDIELTDQTLADDNVIRDNDKPTGDDLCTNFDIDQESLGTLMNDIAGNAHGGALDLHMTGLVYAEFANLIQTTLNATLPPAMQHPIGDPACLTGPGNPKAPGCTGFEGFVIPTDPSRIDDVNLKKVALFPSATDEKLAGLRAGMKPGNQKIAICESPGNTDCTVVGGTFATSFTRLVTVFAGNDVRQLPPEMRDQRFFFRLWSEAVVKFFLVETPNGDRKWSDVHNAPINYDDLFFDNVDSQFELTEYVDRRFVSATQDPTDITITADVIDDIVNDYNFSRDLQRGETGLYLASRSNSADPIGKEPARLTNLFGSPLIQAFYTSDSSLADGGSAPSAFACATDKNWPNGLGCNTPPPLDVNTGGPLLDEAGNAILSNYKGAFSATGTIFALGNQTDAQGNPAPSPIKIPPPTDAQAKISSAMVSLPIHTDAYNLKSPYLSPGNPNKNVLVSWAPKQPGIGFAVPLSGTRDKFISTSTVDLSGTTISANIDYDLFDPLTPTSTSIVLKAVETTDFLGYVFLCVDPSSGDMLAVKMYTPVAATLDWINKHPGSVDACGLVVRYSPYNNYPDFITSLTYGVQISINQGGGFGRVVDVTLFAPGQ